MNTTEFREHAHRMVDWMADYLEHIEEYPVKSQVDPGEIYKALPADIPESGEPMDAIMEDFENIILPGVTHWQSPNFYAYFQANSSPPSVLAEMLTATLGVQAMKWETSPAAEELEERMMEWLMRAMGIPGGWSGVIQDTASSATLVSILTAREVRTKFKINTNGYTGAERFRLYCSTQTHSSIEKAARIAGLGSENVVKIPVDEMMAMDTSVLTSTIDSDIENGYVPFCIVSALGTTGTLAMDPLEELGAIASRYKIWLHVDAAYAGSALLLPEHQTLLKGIEHADSFVFNPHKWLFTNFDCSAYFVKDKHALVNTFSILPEYLKTAADGQVNNYCDWGIALGRRFRALKLWFVLRSYGLVGLRGALRLHIGLAEWLEDRIEAHPEFEMIVPRTLNLVCFRYAPEGVDDDSRLDVLNRQLMDALNASGKIYLTHTVVRGVFVLRMSIGNANVSEQHVHRAWDLIEEYASKINQAED